jgi:hypothetical protein
MNLLKSRLSRLGLLSALTLFAAAAPLQAQDEAAQSAPVVARELANIHTSDRLRLGSQVTVCIRGLHHWIDQGNDSNSLRLVLDGHMLSSSEPTGISPVSQDYANFMLKFNSSNQEERAAWIDIFDSVRNSPDRRVLLTVTSIKNREAFASDIYATFELYPWFASLALILVFLLFVALVVLAMRTDLLRDAYNWADAGKSSTSSLTARKGKAPYSLSRVQMAWWFYLVVASYVYIWLVTQVPDIPTGSVLGLLGISATTGLAAVSLDNSRRSEAEEEHATLETEHKALMARVTQLRARPQIGAELEQELQSREARLNEVQAALAKPSPLLAPVASDGFWADLLRDGSGVSFHRFQMVVWTVVLGFVFIRAVYKDFSMPDFDPALLALMGVYSGTYVGFKFPEKPKA